MARAANFPPHETANHKHALGVGELIGGVALGAAAEGAPNWIAQVALGALATGLVFKGFVDRFLSGPIK